MPALPQFSSCCFGIASLRTGTIIVGIFCLILALAGPGYIAYGIGGIWEAIEVILLIVCVISCILLIIGVLQDNVAYVKFFIIVWLLEIFFSLILLVLIILTAHHGSSYIVQCIISTAVFICIVGYCICIANSYFTNLTGESAIQTA